MNITKEQLEKRKSDMLSLRFEHGLTLQEIANEHGVTRERVRQIIGNSPDNFRVNFTKNLAENTDISNLTTEQIMRLPGTRKVWIKKIGSTRHKYNRTNADGTEELASKILEDNGIPNKLMPIRHPFDILTASGKRIDVKHSDFNIGDCPSQHHVGPTFQLMHLKCGRDCDFFMALIPDKEELGGYAVFIIPSSEAPKSEMSRIRIPWPQCGQKPSKWHKYYKRFDLLCVA